jgi:toxin ParE1/3/4
VAAKPVQFRDLASADLDAAIDYYLSEAGQDVARRFVDAVERTARRAGKNPQLGTLRFAYELGLPGLRALPVGRHPYLMFYVGREDVVDVWRLLHTGRDIPGTLQESANE